MTIKNHLVRALYACCGVQQSTLCERGVTLLGQTKGEAAVELASVGWVVYNNLLTCPACYRLIKIKEEQK